MKNQITGTLITINPIEMRPSKDGGAGYATRSFVLDCTRFDPYTGQRSPFQNTPKLEIAGEKCGQLDHFKVGDMVTVTFEVVGTPFVRKADGVQDIFTRLRVYTVEPYANGQQIVPSAITAPAQPQPVQTAQGGLNTISVQTHPHGLPF